jgi:predicted DNA-binding transcriptional regulator AlpA
MEERILRKQKVRDITGLSSTQIDRMEQEKRFPRRRQITERIVGWSFNEVQAWIQERLHGSVEQQ